MKKLQSIFIHQEYSRRQKQISCMALIVLSALLYWPTLQFGFVLDDKMVISNNKVTQGGADSLKVIWAKGSKTFQKTNSDEAKISRPLTQTYFALVYDKSLPQEVLAKRYHRGQILLYALLVWCLFLCLEKYFAHLSLGLRCIVLALFITHPLHVEVVANLKSADELLASICFVLSLLVLPQSRATSPQILLRQSLLVGMSFFLIYLGYKAKQNILMLAPINVGIVLFGVFKHLSIVHQKKLDNYKWHIGIPSLISLLGIALYRGSQNNPVIQFYARDFDFYQTTQSTYTATQNTFLGMSSTLEIFANSLWTSFLSVKNLLYPAQLIHQYGAYQIPLTSWQSPKPYIALALALCIIGGIFYLLKRSKSKKSTWIAIGIFILPLIAYSHIFIPLPDTYADRFLFMAVLGFLLLLAEASTKMIRKPSWVLVMSLLIGVSYTAKCVQRIPAWQSDDSLFIEDFRQSPNNASILARYASNIENDTNKKEQLYLEALAIHPNFFIAHYDLARLYFSQHRFSQAQHHFSQAIELKSSDDIQYNLTLCNYHIVRNKSQSAYNQDDLPTAITMLDSALDIFPGSKVNNEYRLKTTTLAQMHFVQGAKEKAYKLLINALERDSSHLDYAREGLIMANQAENPSKAVEFGLYLAPARADDATYWTDLENLAQGDKNLLEQIEQRKTEILSVR